MFSLRKLADSIYHLHFSNKYDLGMTFLRYQEYYESPRFRHKAFTIAEYMAWYVKSGEHKSFTYPADWSGYNIPLDEIEQCMVMAQGEGDWNHHDSLMEGIVEMIRAECTEGGYLIGTSDETGEDVLQHEFGHALFNTDWHYKHVIVTKWEGINGTQVWQQARKILQDRGYNDEVILDEAQAYCLGGKDILSHLEESGHWKSFADLVRSEFRKRYEAGK
jgi:hypothetical protein